MFQSGEMCIQYFSQPSILLISFQYFALQRMFQSGEMWHFYVGKVHSIFFSIVQFEAHWCWCSLLMHPHSMRLSNWSRLLSSFIDHLLNLSNWSRSLSSFICAAAAPMLIYPTLRIPIKSAKKLQPWLYIVHYVQCKYNYRNINNLNQYNQNLSEDTNLIFNFNTINRIKYLS